jgi:amidase
VARLRAAGAIVWGKTNMPELAMDFQTQSPLLGRANNPFDVDRTPGGSSGGAAVAAGRSPFEVGSDVAGSVRIPAHLAAAGLLTGTGAAPRSVLRWARTPRDLRSPPGGRR